MKRTVEISPAARHDLADIWEYVSRDNEAAATRLIQSMYRQCVTLSTLPNLGRDRLHDLGAGVRSFPLGNYVIYYRYNTHMLEMIRVLHGARDIGELFNDD